MFISLAGGFGLEFLLDALRRWGGRFGRVDHGCGDVLMESLADAGLRHHRGAASGRKLDGMTGPVDGECFWRVAEMVRLTAHWERKQRWR